MNEFDYRAGSPARPAARRRSAAPVRYASAARGLSLAAFVAILSLSVAAISCATQAGPAVERGAVALEAAGVPADGRFDAVFDRSGDPGRLVARFLRLGLVTDADDKSGDSTVVVSPDGLVMLIDGGAPECADQVKAYLDALGVERIDAVVASHPHVDHVGGLPAILASFPVGTVYASRVDYPTATARAYESAIRASGAELVY
ncbi:MAG TPA: MBL fold metallo-hydrolase, partial [Spirochaetales bacterium]|nr:MBL fold metallo-hydrolase [Spirochaetales bacterium]